MNITQFHTIILICISISITQCNIFQRLDTPGSPEAILDAARACADKKNYDCAKQYYKQLQDTPLSQIALREVGFLGLASIKLTLPQLLKSISTKNVTFGSLINDLIKVVRPYVTENSKKTLLTNYQKSLKLADINDQHFARIILLFGIIVHHLAESVPKNKTSLEKSDIVAAPSECLNTMKNPNQNFLLQLAAITTSCKTAAHSLLIAGPKLQNLDEIEVATYENDITTGFLLTCMNNLSQLLADWSKNQGKLGTKLKGLSQEFDELQDAELNNPTQDGYIRGKLLNQGIGE